MSRSLSLSPTPVLKSQICTVFLPLLNKRITLLWFLKFCTLAEVWLYLSAVPQGGLPQDAGSHAGLFLRCADIFHVCARPCSPVSFLVIPTHIPWLQEQSLCFCHIHLESLLHADLAMLPIWSPSPLVVCLLYSQGPRTIFSWPKLEASCVLWAE